MRCPFCTLHSIVLTLASDMAILYENVAVSILVLSTKQWYSSFLKKVSVFQKHFIETLFQVKVLKALKVFSDLFLNIATGKRTQGSGEFCKCF